MAERLFQTADRDASHKTLEDLLAVGKYPLAECRVEPALGAEMYTVWSGPTEKPPVELRVAEEIAALSPAYLERLADLIAKKLKDS
jgi:hypothetical protein